MTPSEFNKLPKSVQKLGFECERCVKYLMEKKGYDETKATNCVMEIVKEGGLPKSSMHVNMLISILRMTFTDELLESVLRKESERMFNKLIR